MSTAFRVVLEGDQEVPPNNSPAGGLGTVIFDSAAVTASYSFTIEGVDYGPVTGGAAQTETTLDDVTSTHFHNDVRGENGPVVFGQLNPDQDDDDLAIVLNPDGSWTVSGVWETTDPANVSITEFADALGSAAVGSEVPLYFNVHTTAFPGGEIRGQLIAIADDEDNEVTGSGEDDFLPGLGGDDELLGRGGDDTLQGGDGNDRLDGSTGEDVLEGGAGNDEILGRSGDDSADGGLGDDGLYGSAGDDSLFGGDGNDTIEGGSGKDEIGGGAGDDTAEGGAGDDLLDGGLGNDLLVGGAGRDTLTGGAGDDTMVGGAGRDVFAIADTDGVGMDTIGGFFLGGVDTVDLTGLSVASGLGTATVTFDNGAQLTALFGHHWDAADFV
jgi:serralysin